MKYRTSDDTLIRELRTAGASNTEAHELADLAVQLKQLKPSIPAKQPKRNWKLAIPLSIAAGAVAILAVVILAQGALPGSRLYLVQQASDHVAIAVHPSYRATVMMRQAEQVRVLVENQAPSHAVLAALNDYQRQAKTYRTYDTNYEVFEQCKDSLQQAASHASGPDRVAIDRTLAGLQDV